MAYTQDFDLEGAWIFLWFLATCCSHHSQAKSAKVHQWPKKPYTYLLNITECHSLGCFKHMPHVYKRILAELGGGSLRGWVLGCRGGHLWYIFVAGPLHELENLALFSQPVFSDKTTKDNHWRFTWKYIRVWICCSASKTQHAMATVVENRSQISYFWRPYRV